ncbi:error-prone DNA polymerase [Aliidiomarina minuta]|uniref:Error-prone DNA polymerase n=2 Tax=Aliidiomarina minuta TaxID=880057 RepID=A0A432WAP6_9GAMM|nr:error-prone DNA polymerase [Aliidiomarina minuta]
MRYAELHCLSHYSFLRAASSPEEMINKAEELGYEALALTDECSVAGVVKAWQAAKKLTVKLIVGSEFKDQNLGTFILLARNRKGYAQLSALISHCRGQSSKGHYKFSVDDLLSFPCSDCLLQWAPSVSMCPAGVPERIHSLFKRRAWIVAERDLTTKGEAQVKKAMTFSHLYKWPLVSCSGALMHCAERLPLLHTITAIKAGQQVTQVMPDLVVNSEQRLRCLNELQDLYPAQWIEESARIADLCNFDLGSLRYEYPAEVVPAGKTAQGYLVELAQSGIQKRFPEGIPDKVHQQLSYELTLIEEMQYAHFFLTIYDLVSFAASRDILFQGRGSAANSVLCYCLGITAVNPAQSELLFERFISKERDEPPDIDVDFEHERREEVIQYIYSKYGRHRAALTATVITYRLRSALRDVGKALGFPQIQLANILTRLDRRDSEEDWQQQLTNMGILQHPHGHHLLLLTEQLKGFPRHLSQHVGGFVIASERLSDLVPVENAAMPGRTVIQWDKNDIESLKLLKVDVLGLGMLTALRKSLAIVAQVFAKEYQLATLPQEDPEVYGMLQRADAIGIFQVESRAQMNMLPRLKPKTFYDLVVQIAIVRPGPIQGDMVHPYLRRRDGLEAIDYPGEAVKAVLKRTLGVPIFQEQAIKLAMVAAGFTGGEADQLRRAMATWKSRGQLMAFQEKLIQGMLDNGYSDEFATRLFDQICGFGEYGFPESHAASFANLAYASAWLKFHYPQAFYVGLLNSLPMGFYSASQIIQDAGRHQVAITGVCINDSDWDHQLKGSPGSLSIQLGFRLVKGLSKNSIVELLKQRPVSGFTQIDEIKQLNLPGRDMEALASAGAFQSLTGHRYQARWEMTSLGEQLPLLDVAEQDQASYSLPPPTPTEDMVEDYASVSLTLGMHPLALLEQQGLLPAYKKATQLKDLRSGQLVTVMGLVVGRQRPSTSAGVTFVTLEDATGNVNVVIWQDRGRQQRQQWLYAQLLEVKGTLEIQGDIIHVVAGRMTDRSSLLPTRNVKSRDFH